MLAFIPKPFLPTQNNKYCNIKQIYDDYDKIPFHGNRTISKLQINKNDLYETYNKGDGIFYIDFDPIKPIERKKMEINIITKEETICSVEQFLTKNQYINIILESNFYNFMVFSLFSKEQRKNYYILGSNRLSDYEESFQNYLKKQLSLKTIENMGFN